jgi:Rrf2 family transcriptional regulator, cysteine metabolism repressor
VKLSTKARYASRALVELAIKYGDGPVKLKDIASSQDISLKYLEQVMFPLRIAGYVKTQKGSQGGYVLGKDPAQITLLEIVESVEGSLSPVECTDNPEQCERVSRCAARQVWVGLKEVIANELSSITLGQLAEKQKKLDKQ